MSISNNIIQGILYMILYFTTIKDWLYLFINHITDIVYIKKQGIGIQRFHQDCVGREVIPQEVKRILKHVSRPQNKNPKKNKTKKNQIQDL